MTLSERAKAARREYSRSWRAKNKEQVREYNRRWRQQHKDHIRQYNAQYWERRANELAKKEPPHS